MNPRTKQELAQLTKMNPGCFIIVKASRFDRFYDYMSNYLMVENGKSVGVPELKSFI